jgi:hypothetical protein
VAEWSAVKGRPPIDDVVAVDAMQVLCKDQGQSVRAAAQKVVEAFGRHHSLEAEIDRLRHRYAKREKKNARSQSPKKSPKSLPKTL